MGYLDAVVEDGGFAKDHILSTYLVLCLGRLSIFEPHQVHHARSITEMGYHTLLAWSHVEGLEAENAANDLNEGHVACQLVNGIDLRAVHILVGIVFQQVAKGTDAELCVQHLLSLRAYARQKLNVL